MPRIAAQAAALCLTLAACTPLAPQAKAPQNTFRNTASPIYSTADLPIARLVGTWRQVAGFGAATSCMPAPALTIAPSAQGGPVVQYDLCLGQKAQDGQGILASAGAPGRYRLPALTAPLWVLWIDESNRAMALGTPSGEFGMILSKGAIRADHLRAAREVLAWNGYDLTQIYQ